jgi:hypothetical protein
MPPAAVNRRFESHHLLAVSASRRQHKIWPPVSGFTRRFLSRSARPMRRGEDESSFAFPARTTPVVRRIHSWSEL